MFPQKNPTIDKVTARLDIAGISTDAPVLAGISADMTLQMETGEKFVSMQIGNSLLMPTIAGNVATFTNIIFGTNTSIGKNTIFWRTSLGTASQTIYVAEPPTANGIYVNGQNAQGDIAYVSRASTYHAKNVINKNVSLAINIMPYWTDEFFTQQWYVPNAYANTLRHWGGASTARVLLDDVEIIAETKIKWVHSCYLTAPAFGTRIIKVELRAAEGSSNVVTLTGTMVIRRLL